MPAGQPTLYRPEYCDAIVEYFRVEPYTTVMKREYFHDGSIKSETPVLIANEFPTIERFADKIGVHKDTIYEWVKVHGEFSDAFTRARSLSEAIWKINGLQGLYNSQFAQFIGKNCFGYSDKTDISITEQRDPVDADEVKSELRSLIEQMSPEQKKEFFGI